MLVMARTLSPACSLVSALGIIMASPLTTVTSRVSGGSSSSARAASRAGLSAGRVISTSPMSLACSLMRVTTSPRVICSSMILAMMSGELTSASTPQERSKSQRLRGLFTRAMTLGTSYSNLQR